MRNLVYISYNHRDRAFCDELCEVLLRDVRLREFVWVDTMIPDGAVWRDVIDDHVARARIMIMLVSANYLDPKCQAWIHEIPQALERTKRENSPSCGCP